MSESELDPTLAAQIRKLQARLDELMADNAAHVERAARAYDEKGRLSQIIAALALGAYVHDTIGDMREDARRACELIGLLLGDPLDDDEAARARGRLEDRLHGRSLWDGSLSEEGYASWVRPATVDGGEAP